ncbi:hypothetical protein [Microbispora sp. NBRC 16548]|uniref:DUF6197 family protein n=1 Tax=Microbispora sp. NBRC 16548 TaxID=3030994 RepID=UPI0024A33BF6|nr:hypothetical protein [Microbispora sp. NBRC 16548]GLX06736.1 hypothetical protein Misp03_36630 [Microbispora sp. NBRC 16548]
MTTTARDVLAAAANRIERSTWASRHQQPGGTLSDAIALEVRDAPGTDAQRASLQDAAFEALRCHVAPSAADINDWLRDPDRTQAEVVAALRGAATATSDHEDEDAAHQERFWGPGGHLQTEVPPDTRLVVNGEHYAICDEDAPGFRGYGGRRFDVQFHDGRTVTTTNLWCQGTVPAQFRHLYPDNARFVQPNTEGTRVR